MTKNKSLAGLLAEMKAYGEKNHVPIININGLKVLVETVRAARPRKVLEIGTAIGYSTLYIAANSAEDVRITTLELSRERAAEAEAFIARSPYKDNIRIMVGDAGENLLQLQDKFDLVFIDAAKGQYPDYLRKVYPMLGDNAVIIADNVLFRGYVRGGVETPRRFRTIVKRLREYIGLVEENQEFQTQIFENGDGLAVSWRKNI